MPNAAKPKFSRSKSSKPRARAEAYASEAAASAAPPALTSTMKEKLRQTVARIEKLEEEKAGVASDIKDAYAEAKGFGYDTKALRKVIALRKMDHDKRIEQENWIDLYRQALGDI
jgi:uncharacterized protein (UPF0335 family)